MAYTKRQPQNDLIFHTDNGSNYCNKAFQDYLSQLNITHSFSRPHVPYDNSVMESFFASLKKEELYRRKYRSEKKLFNAINDYMVFYNEKRPHYQNSYKTPLKKETEYFSSLE